jgi:hypothetical protein
VFYFEEAFCELGLLLHDREWETLLLDADQIPFCSQIGE